MKPACWLMSATALLPLPLLAQPTAPGPTVIPTRDVDIAYHVAGGRIERMRWQISARKLRVDPPTPGAYVIVDLTNRHVSFIRPAQHSVIDTVADGLPVPVPGAGGFTRRGTDTVIGLPCTVWGTAGPNGAETQSCLTADGVLLRTRVVQAGQNGAPDQAGVLLEAATVTYGPIDPAAMIVPPDDTHLSQDPAPP